MAEHLLRSRLDVASDWHTMSAGIAAAPGMPPSAAGVDVMAECGVDLSAHRSRPLTGEVVDASDVIVVMTASHREQVEARFPAAAQKVFLLGSFGHGGDVPDPIGLSADAYRRVRRQIEQALPELVAFLGNLETGKA
jgi:protein-tyrosine phosphatase